MTYGRKLADRLECQRRGDIDAVEESGIDPALQHTLMQFWCCSSTNSTASSSWARRKPSITLGRKNGAKVGKHPTTKRPLSPVALRGLARKSFGTGKELPRMGEQARTGRSQFDASAFASYDQLQTQARLQVVERQRQRRRAHVASVGGGRNGSLGHDCIEVLKLPQSERTGINRFSWGYGR